MGENLTVRQKAKLAYLRRLCMTWSRFMEIKYTRIDVFVENGYVMIFMYRIYWLKQPNGTPELQCNNAIDYCSMSQLGVKIKEYRAKIKREFKIRHLTEDEKANKRASTGVR